MRRNVSMRTVLYRQGSSRGDCVFLMERKFKIKMGEIDSRSSRARDGDGDGGGS
jgi:hypothetical protein